MAIERNITTNDDFFLGEDKVLPDTIYQSDGITLQNVTGWTISFMVKKHATDLDADAKVTKTTANGGIVLTAPLSGLITITLASADTASLPAGLYAYEVKRTDVFPKTVLTTGTLTLRQGVIRA
jgi:hypothetical protein